MIEPLKVESIIREHFGKVSLNEFSANVEKFCPEVNMLALTTKDDFETESNQLVLFQSEPQPLPLNAYLACALSNLTSLERQLMFTLSDMISVVCSGLDIELYEPRKKTDPVHHSDISDTEVFHTDRERVLSSDLLIHLCHHASTGSGEELDFAHNALMPIILISHDETKVSRMITGIPALKIHITYSEPEELRKQLYGVLHDIRPLLEERKLTFSEYDVNIVGKKIRTLREEHSLTREDVAVSSQNLINVELLKNIEDSTDKTSNPTLLQLRAIASILKTTVADLVEPDLNEHLMTVFQNILVTQSAARSGYDTKDRKRILTRLIRRFLDVLEED